MSFQNALPNLVKLNGSCSSLPNVGLDYELVLLKTKFRYILEENKILGFKNGSFLPI